MEQGKRVGVRSYRGVFRFERRIFKVDRWRLPLPYGVPVRAIGYALVCVVAVALAGRLPLLGALLEVLPPLLHWVALPCGGAYLLCNWRIDGRPPHHVLGATLAWGIRARTLSGLRRCPRQGASFTPLGEVALRPDAEGPEFRPGRLKGPADVIFRYPARVQLERVGPLAGRDPAARMARAKRLRLSVEPGAPAMLRGRELHIPAGTEVIFE